MSALDTSPVNGEKLDSLRTYPHISQLFSVLGTFTTIIHIVGHELLIFLVLLL